MASAGIASQESQNGAQSSAGADDKKQVGMKLTGSARRLRASLSQKLGIDQTAVVELAIRRLAQAEGVE